METIILSALLLRVGLYLYSFIQDKTPLKFTDIDYYVFTDAARYVTQGQSPYLRSTYRYTPLLAYLNTLNIYVHPAFGKLLFTLCDLINGWLIFAILSRYKVQKEYRLAFLAFWILNPFVAVISIRGSSESILGVLILGVVYSLKEQKYHLAAILYGLSVHFKIYPIVFALSLWLSIEHSVIKGKSRSWMSEFFSWKRIQFGVMSAFIFLILGVLFYQVYGQEFLQESYLYHVSRKDHRHNFSLYFYSLYLASTPGLQFSLLETIWTSLGSFLPQFGLVIYLGAKLVKKDVNLALFCQTFAFVNLNKVCTSQYFMWYLFLLPLVLCSSGFLKKEYKTGILCLLLWILSQSIWLYFAYQLEHKGQSTFRMLWASSAFMYLSNSWILSRLIISSL